MNLTVLPGCTKSHNVFTRKMFERCVWHRDSTLFHGTFNCMPLAFFEIPNLFLHLLNHAAPAFPSNFGRSSSGVPSSNRVCRRDRALLNSRPASALLRSIWNSSTKYWNSAKSSPFDFMALSSPPERRVDDPDTPSRKAIFVNCTSFREHRLNTCKARKHRRR